MGVSEQLWLSAHDSETRDILDLADDEGWEDLEPDVETVKVRCLLCDLLAEDAKFVLLHCKDSHGLDIVKVQKDLGLEFLEMIKLINYIRSEAKINNTLPSLSTKAAFQDEHYLKPVLEDDALLYSLHDIIGEGFDLKPSRFEEEMAENEQEDSVRSKGQIQELEEKLQRAQLDLEARKKELDVIKLRLNASTDFNPDDDMCSGNDIWESGNEAKRYALANEQRESSYFASYSGHEIHETMLKDTVRTDAYRDFIYENKDLFEGKTVLDVGCGTGILSMFCARAGAAKVIAVDNSDIIDFARENFFRNGMQDTISCLRGKIEEIALPVGEVDVIVSEWMGYCLLYEAMLDSVIWARDRYLKDDGLMIPSHCTLRIAPLTDAEFIEHHIHHWKNVYGFDMISMHKNIYNDVLVKEIQDVSLPADSTPFLQLDLRKISTKELSFDRRPFTLILATDVEILDGFVIWFDIFFFKTAQAPVDLKAENCKREGGDSVAFTTGPHGKSTHWQQGVLLIDHRDRKSATLKKGQSIEGMIGYKKREEDNRALNIEVQWQIEDSVEKGRQSWCMR